MGLIWLIHSIRTPGRETKEDEPEATVQEAPELPTPVQPNEEGKTTGKPQGGAGRSRKPSGGLHVEHQNLGEEAPRGRYVSDRRMIIINLDHPEASAAYKLGGPEDPAFVRLAWEIAITEYAIALAQELVVAVSRARRGAVRHPGHHRPSVTTSYRTLRYVVKNRPKETLKWPRPGYPLVPALYRKAWLDEPLPKAVLQKVGLPSYTTVGTLDESVWGGVRET